MNGAAIAVLASIVGMVVAVIGIVFTARTFARSQAKERADALQTRYNDGYQAGMREAQPATDRLRDQRDDARRDRDRCQAESDHKDRRIEQLEDELRNR